MKQLWIAGFLLLMASQASAQVMWQVKTNSSQKWFLSQADEFNAEKINPDLWNGNTPAQPYNILLDVYYKAENLQYRLGYVSLLTRKETTYAWLEGKEREQNKSYFIKHGKVFDNGNYPFAYSGAMLSSNALYRTGYFEMRFKISDQKGIFPALQLIGDKQDVVTLFGANGAAPGQAYTGVACSNGCNLADIYSKKSEGGYTKLSEPLAKDWNIISAEWDNDRLTCFFNGAPIASYHGLNPAGKKLVLSNGVSDKTYGLKPGPAEQTSFPASLDVDYVRIWSKADTSGRYKDNYMLFENSGLTIDNRQIYSGEVKKRNRAISKAKALELEQGTITLLPVSYNKYSLSVQGQGLSSMQVEVIDRFNEKVAGFALSNVPYYIMDLSALPTGPYRVRISVLNQVLEQEIPIINPEKVGEQRDGK